MANFKYFTNCGTETVELTNVYHDGHGSTKAHHFIGKCPVCGQRHPANRVVQYKSNPSKHECNAKCMGAHGRSMVCECKCGGKNHGKSFAVAA
jgi:hypothetical protein